MKKAHIAEEMHKIEEVRKNPEAANTGPNNCGKTAMAQQKEKRMQQKLPVQFEQEFLNP